MLLAGLSWATHVYNFQIPVWKVVNIDPSTVLAELSYDVVDVLCLEYCTYSIPVHPPSVLTPYIVRHTYHGLVHYEVVYFIRRGSTDSSGPRLRV